MTGTWKVNANIQKRPAFYLLLLLFLISVAIRLPNLNRPVSKHHEFITAVLLMNIQSWRQAGGGAVFHYTPLMSYQNPGDRHPEKGPNIDSRNNELYLSLGPGWYLISYFFYQLFHLPADPIGLRLLNLLFGLATVILGFYFFEQLLPAGTRNRYFRVLTGCVLFLFSPGILWYTGNGYVHPALMLPFTLALLMILLPMLRSPQKIRALPLAALSLLVILSLYMDWFVVFLCIIAAVWALVQSARPTGPQNSKYLLLALVLTASLALGVTLIFWQFASYAGSDAVASYWKLRFFARSFANTTNSYPSMLLALAGHLITCYLPLLLLLAMGIILHRIIPNSPAPGSFNRESLFRQLRIFSAQERLFISIYGGAVILYDLALLDWSAAHEFSMIPAGILLAWLGARLLPIPQTKIVGRLLVALFFLLCIGQYYFINRPGPISRDGMPFDTYQRFGQRLRQIPPDDKIFSNLPENCPMIEYYAGRNITQVHDSASAKQLMREWGLTRAAWVESEGFQFRGIQFIHP